MKDATLAKLEDDGDSWHNTIAMYQSRRHIPLISASASIGLLMASVVACPVEAVAASI
jgi:hypothetical protein